jgi:hypothetical protein
MPTLAGEIKLIVMVISRIQPPFTNNFLFVTGVTGKEETKNKAKDYSCFQH